jgi:hypothetical protein
MLEVYKIHHRINASQEYYRLIIEKKKTNTQQTKERENAVLCNRKRH